MPQSTQRPPQSEATTQPSLVAFLKVAGADQARLNPSLLVAVSFIGFLILALEVWNAVGVQTCQADQEAVQGTPRSGLSSDLCPKGRAIVIPVYNGHYAELQELLRSMLQHVVDLDAATILLVPSNQQELRETEALVRPLVGNTTLEVRLVDFPTILEQYGIVSEVPMIKYPYQSLKKFYGARYLGCYWSLEMDADSRIIKRMSFEEMFDDFENQPTYFYYKDPNIDDPWLTRTRNEEFVGALDGLTSHFNNWGYQAWFMERRALDLLFEHVENKHNTSMYMAASTNERLWGPVAFQYYLFMRQDLFRKYRFVNVYDALQGFALKEFGLCFQQGWNLEYVTQNIQQMCYHHLHRLMTTFRWRFLRVQDSGQPLQIAAKLVRTVPTLSVLACGSIPLPPSQ